MKYRAESGLYPVHAALAPFRRAILRSACAVVANSAGLKAMSELADSTPVLVIANGVDTSFFKPAARLQPSDAPLRLLFVGRFQSQKNLLWMLDQLAGVRLSTRRTFVLDLVGDGPLRHELEDRIRNLMMADIVSFHGWTDRNELRTFYQSADLVLNPSLYEGMPNVVLEAMACGRPVLVSRVPGNEAVVVHGVSGWLYSSGDSDDFRNRVQSFLEFPEIAIPLGAAARERAEREFSWDRATQSYLELLNGTHPNPPNS